MLSHRLCILALSIPAILAQNFNFTLPVAPSTLNLSASAIDISWNRGIDPYTEADLAFTGPGFSYPLVKNLSISTNHYTWDPYNVSQALQQGKTQLNDATIYQFQAMMHNANTTAGATVVSGEYSVDGYPYLSSAEAGAVRPSWAGLGMAALGMMMAAAMSC
ncbi:hypothetical protein LTR78_001785 [Recurvomyces mirabilis]|uniref:Uncharacterized protein n=1 Tax=Recurvomyces mirabilis TaxID=574656 RepID=A0AAE0WV91_9PEZI|nr:hypothetical protein LTR78_001785 [Recurvomyces mirabilis]KAK5156776.1 hypothetical protein LTS14_004989 [Recurvomyces mirabilis]